MAHDGNAIPAWWLRACLELGGHLGRIQSDQTYCTFRAGILGSLDGTIIDDLLKASTGCPPGRRRYLRRSTNHQRQPEQRLKLATGAVVAATVAGAVVAAAVVGATGAWVTGAAGAVVAVAAGAQAARTMVSKATTDKIRETFFETFKPP